MNNSYNEDLIKFIKSIKGASSQIRKELDKVIRVLKRPNTVIKMSKTGQKQISGFVFLLFSRHPHLMTDENKKAVEELAASIGLAPKPEISKHSHP